MGWIEDNIGEGAENSFNAITPNVMNPEDGLETVKNVATFTANPLGAATQIAGNVEETQENVNDTNEEKLEDIENERAELEDKTVGEWKEENPQLDVLNPDSDSVDDSKNVKDVVQGDWSESFKDINDAAYEAETLENPGIVVDGKNQLDQGVENVQDGIDETVGDVQDKVNKTVNDVENTWNGITPNLGQISLAIGATLVLLVLSVIAGIYSRISG